jgi:hypothetical protein
VQRQLPLIEFCPCINLFRLCKLFLQLFREFNMCQNNIGVVKRLDLVSISEDMAEFVKQLDKKIDVEISVDEIKKIEKKLHKIVQE